MPEIAIEGLAILTLALDISFGGIDLDIVGWILMVGGVTGLLFTVLIWGPRSRRMTTSDPTTTTTRRVHERTDI